MAKRTIAEFDIRLSANTASLRRDFAHGETAANGFSRNMAGLARSLAAVGAVVATISIGALVAGLRSGSQAAAEFNRRLANSTAIMANISEETRDRMTKVAQEVASVTKFSAAEGAEAYYFLASAGQDAAQAMASLPQVAKFAQAGNFDLALATDLATDAQSALGLTVKDTQQNLENLTRVTDVLIKANTLANASAEQFSRALTTKSGAAARQLGKDVEEAVSVLAAFADQGVKDAEAGTALAIVLRDLSTKAIDFKAAFADAGIRVFDDAGEMRNVADIVEDIERALAGLSDEAQKTKLLELGFSDKSLGFLVTLLGTSDKIRAYERELRNAGGTTQEVADKQLTAMDKALNKLSATWEAFSITAFSPAMEAIGDSLLEVLDELGPDIDRLAMQAKNFGIQLAETIRTNGPAIAEFARTAIQQIGKMLELGTAVLAHFDEWEKSLDNLEQKLRSIGSMIGRVFIPIANLLPGGDADRVERDLEQISQAAENLSNSPPVNLSIEVDDTDWQSFQRGLSSGFSVGMQVDDNALQMLGAEVAAGGTFPITVDAAEVMTIRDDITGMPIEIVIDTRQAQQLDEYIARQFAGFAINVDPNATTAMDDIARQFAGFAINVDATANTGPAADSFAGLRDMVGDDLEMSVGLDIDDSGLDQLREKAERIAEQFRLPEEVFADRIAELNELIEAEVLSQENYERAAADARQRLLDQIDEQLAADRPSFQPTRGVAAVEAGTRAGFSAIQAAVRQDRDIRQAEAEKKRRDAKRNQLLTNIERNTGQQLTVNQVTI